jgi:soluble cytochrome b562
MARRYDELLEDTKNIRNELRESQEQIDAYLLELFDDKAGESIRSKINRISSNIDALVIDLEAKKDEVDAFYVETISGTTTVESTKTKIENAHTEIEELLDAANEALTKSEKELAQFKTFYQEVFGEIDDITKKREGGHRKELIASIKDLAKYKELQSKKYDALFAKIESLLPGATSAGLASAFLTRKEVFAKPNQLWTATFITALLGMFAYSIATFQTITTLEGALVQILNHLPLYIPVVWLAIYASKRKSENKRLEEEYAHRESLANSFIGYKEQVEQLNKDDTEALKEFLNNILNEISKNPSETLDGQHGDSTPLKELITLLPELKKLLWKDPK